MTASSSSETFLAYTHFSRGKFRSLLQVLPYKRLLPGHPTKRMRQHSSDVALISNGLEVEGEFGLM